MINKFYQDNVTIVPIEDSPFKLNLRSKSFFLGSCFSTNLFNKYSDLHLNTINSPFGNIYNPVSIRNSLKIILDKKLLEKDQCLNIDGLYQHFDFHSKSGKKDIDTYIKENNELITESHNFLLDSNMLILTLGTSFIFEKDNRVVNNCHKLNKELFTRRSLSVDEITNNLIPILQEIKKLNNKINIVITLSPIRHLRDDPTENSLSKATLRVAIDKITRTVSAYYFPSYEILLDELRDYRWYDKSLNHPNKEAVDYITNRFIDVTSCDELKDYIKRITKINQMINHKVINEDSLTSKKFIQKREIKLKQIQKDYYYLDKLQEIKY